MKISNDLELEVMQERIGRFQRRLADLRQAARPEEFDAVSSGYRLEIERMQAEVLEYLLRPVATEAEMQPA
jgi:hypothetical protein